MLLKGKAAVITGCLSGIGKKTLELFASNGADVWACCERQTDEFERHVASLQNEYGVSITPLYFDLMKPEEIKQAMKQIVQSKRNVDVLVNIAGITHNALFPMTSLDDMRRVFEIDFFAQMLVTQYVSKIMTKYKSGSIINISSVTAIDGNRGQVAYGAAKAAFMGATKTLAIELGDYGIRVNAVAPGVINTDMTAALSTGDYDTLVAKTSFKRGGLPEEVSKVLVFLASDMSSYVTGQTLRIDGGM